MNAGDSQILKSPFFETGKLTPLMSFQLYSCFPLRLWCKEAFLAFVGAVSVLMKPGGAIRNG